MDSFPLSSPWQQMPNKSRTSEAEKRRRDVGFPVLALSLSSDLLHPLGVRPRVQLIPEPVLRQGSWQSTAYK